MPRAILAHTYFIVRAYRGIAPDSKAQFYPQIFNNRASD